MEAKIDKRTKAYKDMVRDAINHAEPPIGTTQIPVDEMVGEVGFVEDLSPQSPEKPDYSKVENNPGFKLCGKCGGDTLELNEDGSLKRRRQPEMCRDCVWENEPKITCEDGIIRHKSECKRISHMVGKDEVFTWVKR